MARASGARDLNYLARRMPDIAQAVELDVIAFRREIATRVVASVARRTPVDVATARSNWITSINAPSQARRAAYSPFQSRYGSPPGAGGSVSESRNQAGTVWAAAGTLKALRDEADIYIANNMPYIGRLNQGHSNQAPAGFVEAGIREGIAAAISGFNFPNLRRL